MFLEVAIQCGVERLQSACVAQMLMEIVNGVRVRDTSNVNVQNELIEAVEEILNYEDFLPSVRKKVHKATAYMLIYGMRDGRMFTIKHPSDSYHTDHIKFIRKSLLEI